MSETDAKFCVYVLAKSLYNDYLYVCTNSGKASRRSEDTTEKPTFDQEIMQAILGR